MNNARHHILHGLKPMSNCRSPLLRSHYQLGQHSLPCCYPWLRYGFYAILQINPTRCTILLVGVSLQPADRTPPIQSDEYQCHTDTMTSPDDGHMVARNMCGREINILSRIVHQVGFICKNVQGCTVKETTKTQKHTQKKKRILHKLLRWTDSTVSEATSK